MHCRDICVTTLLDDLRYPPDSDDDLPTSPDFDLPTIANVDDDPP